MTWDFVYRGENRDIDAATRSTTEGEFVRLSHGWTHFESSGDQRRRPIVLVHGFSVPYFIWDPTFEALASAGLHPVRYDLYGRGFSDRPHTGYDMQLFLSQLGELVDTLGADRVDLAGLSMGGAIAAAFTAQFPDRVHRLLLIGPAGAEAIPMSLLYRIAVLPGISEMVMSIVGTDQMVKAAASDFFDAKYVEIFQDRYRPQMQYRGFKRAILSSLRHRMLAARPQVYARLGGLATSVMLIWGEQDRTVPFAQSRRMLELLPQAVFHPVANCGHIPHFEQPALVNPWIVDFFSVN